MQSRVEPFRKRLVTDQVKQPETIKLYRGKEVTMKGHRSEPGNHVKLAPMSHFCFHKVNVAALIPLAAVMIGGIPLAEAQERTVKTFTVTETRDMRFGEILVVKASGIEVYNTTGINNCPPELWDELDTGKLAEELGALSVRLNGPKFWMMDTQTVSFGEKVSFGGLEARWAATLDPAVVQSLEQGFEPYKVFTPKKTQKMVYAKGKPVFEIVDPDGNIYVLQAHGERFPMESLPKLGERLEKLPEGWLFRTRILAEDLVLDLGPDQTIFGIGDEFRQYYTRIQMTQ